MNPFYRQNSNPFQPVTSQPTRSSNLDQATFSNEPIAPNDPAFNSPPPSRRFWNEAREDQRNLDQRSTEVNEHSRPADEANLMGRKLENIKKSDEGNVGRMSIEEKENCRNVQNVNNGQYLSSLNNQQRNIFGRNNNITGRQSLQPPKGNNLFGRVDKLVISSSTSTSTNPLTSNIFRQSKQTVSNETSEPIRLTTSSVIAAQTNIFETFSKPSSQQRQQDVVEQQDKPAVVPPVLRKSQLFFNEQKVEKNRLLNVVQGGNLSKPSTSIIQSALPPSPMITQNHQTMVANTSQTQPSSQIFPPFNNSSTLNLPQTFIPFPITPPTYQLPSYTQQIIQPFIFPLYPITIPQQHRIQLNTRDPYFESIKNSPSQMLKLKLADIYMFSLNVLSKKDELLPNERMNEKSSNGPYADRKIGNFIGGKKKVVKQMTPFEMLKVMHSNKNINNHQEQPQTLQTPQQKHHTILKTYNQWHHQIIKSTTPQQGLEEQFKKTRHYQKYGHYLIKQLPVFAMKIENQCESMMRMKKYKNFVQVERRVEKFWKKKQQRGYKMIGNHNAVGQHYVQSHYGNGTRPGICSTSPSTNDKSTPKHQLNIVKSQTFSQSSPETSQFKISRHQQPFTKKYCINIISLEESPLKWLLTRLRYGIRKSYQGQVRFQRFTCQRDINDAIIRDLLQKKKQLYDMFLLSHEKTEWFDFLSYSSLSFNLKLTGVLALPLRLRLPSGCEYFYEEYTGGEIKGLVIYNQFVQVCYLEDVLIKERDQKQRDLKDKIRLEKEGVWIGSQMLKKKCRVNVWRQWGCYDVTKASKKSSDGNDNEIFKDNKQNMKMVPIQKNQLASDFLIDCFPQRISCIMQWKQQNPLQKEFQGLRELRNICLLMITMILVLGMLGHSLRTL